MKNLFGVDTLSMMLILFAGQTFTQKPKSEDELLKEIATLGRQFSKENEAVIYDGLVF